MDLPEQSIAQWQQAFDRGEWTSLELCERLLRRIAAIDAAGPALRSVIEANADALEIAAALDAERRDRGPRGPLHGVPIMVKDSIDTGDRMMTTAGSLALVGNHARRDAFVVRALRRAGAVLLAKTNMSEWGYMRSTRACSGWSSRGGQTRNPYVLDRSPLGSSSGSAAAVAANLCVASIGAEVDGSIVRPASANCVVGLKPTVGLASRRGVIGVAEPQDTVGPLARCVADVAVLLNASVNQTLSRSVITHVTVTLALLALLLFGGQAIHSFTATMMFGVVLVGTYTSIFIAAPILIYLGVGTGRDSLSQSSDKT